MPFKPGDHVVLTQDVDRLDDFVAPAGLTGMVVTAQVGYLEVWMRQHLLGAEDWRNCIIWDATMESHGLPEEYLKVISPPLEE